MATLLDEIRAAVRELAEVRDRDRTAQMKLEALLARARDAYHGASHAQMTALQRAAQASEDAGISRAGAERAHGELEAALVALAEHPLPDADGALPGLPPVEDVFRPALSTVKVRALPRHPGGTKGDPDPER